MVSGQSGQTQFNWNYLFKQNVRGINAISDIITINSDLGWTGGLNDDNYYVLSCFVGPAEGQVTSASTKLELNLMFTTNNSTPTISFQPLLNGVSQGSFVFFGRRPPSTLVGRTYIREIIFTPTLGGGSGGGDSTDPGMGITYRLTDITAGGNSVASVTTTLPSIAYFNMAYDGLTWWTYSNFPFIPEYFVTITNLAFSFDGGTSYNQIDGPSLSIFNDRRYNGPYPLNPFNIILPGSPPVIRSSN